MGSRGRAPPTATHSLTPVAVPTEGAGFEQIASFQSGACALDDDAPGVLVCWGNHVADGAELTVAPRSFALPEGVTADVLASTSPNGLLLDANGVLYTVRFNTGVPTFSPVAFSEPLSE